jgi:hypothetical protein
MKVAMMGEQDNVAAAVTAAELFYPAPRINAATSAASDGGSYKGEDRKT